MEKIMVGAIDQVKKLAEAENHLWELTSKGGFAKIEANGQIIGGEALVGKLDKFFADPKHPEISYPVKDLSFLKDTNGKVDPEVAAFAQAHPDKVAGFVEYANQYGVIAENKKGLTPEQAEKTIGAVDALYPAPDYKYVDGKFDVSKITEKVTDMNVTDGKGFAHQLKHQFGLDDKQAFKLAEQILDSNSQIPNHNRINPKATIHVSEEQFNQLSGGSAQGTPQVTEKGGRQ
jgi:hypothetical protein